MTELLILDRERWMRGSPAGKATRLLTKDGQMCCLGFCMAQHGFPVDDLLDNGEPQEAVGQLGSQGGCPEYLTVAVADEYCDEDEEGAIIRSFGDTELTCEAMSINDDSLTNDEQKVAMLNEEFSKVGVKVILVDTPEECEALGGLPADFAKHLVQKVRLPL